MRMRLTHPSGLYILFFTEMWERFSFYGMRALLVLYMTKVFLFSDHVAFGVYGAYLALVYTTPVLGGFLADRILGFKRAIYLGGILIMCGHVCLSLTDTSFFYLGLSFIIAGTGFFKSSISSLVGELYAQNDPRRDSGFTLFYMGINIGALLATLSCGFIAEAYGWHYGFGLAAIGMLLGLINFALGQPHLATVGSAPEQNAVTRPRLFRFNIQHGIILASFASVWLFSLLLQHEVIVGYLLLLTGIGSTLIIICLALSSPTTQRSNLFTLLLLFLLSIVFFSLFEQAGSSLTLFTERSIDRSLFNWSIAAWPE